MDDKIQDVPGQLATLRALQSRVYSDHGVMVQAWVSSKTGERVFVVLNVVGRGLAEVYLEAFLERSLYHRRLDSWTALDAFESAMEYSKLEIIDPLGWAELGGWDDPFFEQLGVRL